MCRWACILIRRARGLRKRVEGGIESEYDDYDDDDRFVACRDTKRKMKRLPWQKHASRSMATPGIIAVATAVVVAVRPAMSSSSPRTAVLGRGSGAAALPPLPFPFL